MKSVKISSLLLAVGLGMSISQAAIISVNLTDGGPGPEIGLDQTAGAVLAGNWNAINGLNGSGLRDIDTDNLINSIGDSTGVTYSQSNNVGGYYGSGSATDFTGTVANQIMTNYADTSSSYSITLTGMNSAVGELYDVYIYSARNYDNTGTSEFTVDGKSQFLQNRNLTGDYKESGFATLAEAEENLNSGNYVVFRGVSLDDLTIGITAHESNGGNLAAINGFQIVPVPEPSAALLLGLSALGLSIRRRR